MEDRGTDGQAIRRMRIAFWILKAANTHSEYVIFIAFPLQQRLHERASMLRYTYIACPFKVYFQHKIPLLDLVLNQKNPAHIVTHC
jgi:hypothetical protein